MAANTSPIFSKAPKVSGAKLTSANTTRDATGTNVSTIFTAGAEGAKINRIRVYPKGVNVASVLRLFVNDGLGVAGANNFLVYEKTLTAVAASSEVSEVTSWYELGNLLGSEFVPPIDSLPPNGKILATIGTSIAAGIDVVVFGGDF
jgi:hypothetical protein